MTSLIQDVTRERERSHCRKLELDAKDAQSALRNLDVTLCRATLLIGEEGVCFAPLRVFFIRVTF